MWWSAELSPMTSLPILETDRLILRGFREDDAPRIAHLNTDPEIMRYVRPADNWGVAYHWALEKARRQRPPFGFWIIEDRMSGWHGFALFQPLPGTDELEIGFRLPKTSWGRGVASEAAARLIRHGFEATEVPRICAVAYLENTGSVSVLQKCGLEHRGTIAAYGFDALPFFVLDRRT